METEGNQSNQNENASVIMEERRYFWAKRLSCFCVTLGLLSMSSCFVLAYFAFETLGDCGKRNKDCELSPTKYQLARDFRISAASLFILGIFIIIVTLYKYRKVANEHNRRKTQTMISYVTECGRLKTPVTPASSRRSFFPVDNIPVSELKDGLPEYEMTVNIDSAGGASAIETGVVDALKPIDEDIVNPPPSYDEALNFEDVRQNRELNTPPEGLEA